MMEPATRWDVKRVWRKESRAFNQRLIQLTVMDTVSCYQTLWTQQKGNRFPHKVFTKTRKSPGENKRKPRRP